MAAKSRHPMKRVEVSALVKRLVDPSTISIRRDIILFYKVFGETGRWDFWKVYEPGFALPSMAYYLTEAGRAKWRVDLALFDLEIPQEVPPELSTEKVGEDKPTECAPRTLAQLLA